MAEVKWSFLAQHDKAKKLIWCRVAIQCKDTKCHNLKGIIQYVRLRGERKVILAHF